MPLTSIYVPFQNQSLNGVIRTIARKTHSKNVSSDGFVSVTASSVSSGYPSIIILDNKDNKYWRSISDENQYFIIDFGLFRVDIEGYTLYTGNGDYRSEWYIYASEDGENWELIGTEGVTPPNDECIKSYKTENYRLRFFKMQAGGVAVDPEIHWFAMYSVDIFGKLIVPSSLNFISKYNKVFLFSISTLVSTILFTSTL